ncbi:MAG: hypothetical protein HQL99_13355 [Magnetococcales bacterium]|nr:hypothetical protein [Magnetococcales bacterium]
MRLDIASFAAQTPFELVVDDQDQGGNRPVSVTYSKVEIKVTQWSVAASVPDIVPLTVKQTGLKRIKLYCSKADAVGVEVYDGSVTPSSRSTDVNVSNLGRRAEPLIETINWQGSTRQKLKYFYDAPSVEILHQTVFRDRTGRTLSAPQYDQTAGEFFTSAEAHGALIVKYYPEFTLLQASYGNGAVATSREQFTAMQNAWMTGDITTAEIPPVRIFVLSNGKATEGSFSREFWPKANPGISYSIGPSRTVTHEGGDWTATSVTTETRRLFDPKDQSSYQDVQYITSFVAQDANTGRTMNFNIPAP